jgi:starch phosphorylase
MRTSGYQPKSFYDNNNELKYALDWLSSDFFTPETPGILEPLRYSLLDGGDPFMVMADFESYCRTQDRVNAAFADKERWARMAIHNTARMGKFSSDRTIREYATEIWKLTPLAVSKKTGKEYPIL